jgi:hypothetical protein
MIFLKADIAVYHRCPVVPVIGSLHIQAQPRITNSMVVT